MIQIPSIIKYIVDDITKHVHCSPRRFLSVIRCRIRHLKVIAEREIVSSMINPKSITVLIVDKNKINFHSTKPFPHEHSVSLWKKINELVYYLF